ncbi:PqqD family protein [Oricola indica]|uniref:PqqD family protein n=1 Tax=Oricola indica TaxID=2872591 RepID=UPI003CCB9986
MTQASRNGISPATRLVISLKATLKSMGENEGGVLLKLDSGELFTVNDTTVAFLNELDGNKSLAEIVNRLSDIYDVDVSLLEADLIEIADDLMDQNLLRAV